MEKSGDAVVNIAQNLNDTEGFPPSPPPYSRQTTWNRVPQDRFHFSDSSEPMFSMYLKIAEKDDEKSATFLKADADKTLVFIGLFSTTVAALIAVSIQDLRQNPQDTSAFYLSNIYQLLAESNVSRASIPPPPAIPPAFSPPKYAIWVNSLWFLSLAISFTCALLATLLQQWARRHSKVIPPWYSPGEQARMRVFFAAGLESLQFPRLLEALPLLLHLSLFIFFAGLVIFLYNINLTVFRVVTPWIGLCGGAYLFATFMPIVRPDSPFYTPISPSLWLSRTVEMAVRKISSEIDGRILKRIFDSLSEDHELGQFFQRIPGFCNSNPEVVMDLQGSLSSFGKELSSALVAFLGRTWSSSLVSESDKLRWLVVLVKAIDAARLPDGALEVLTDIFPWDNLGVARSVEMGRLLRSWDPRSNHNIGLCARSIVSGVIANVQQSDDSWIALAADQLGEDLPSYVQHGNDSVLLANLIDITRHIFDSSLGDNRDMARAASYILPSLSNFDIQRALPKLQHEFHALWDEVSKAENNSIATAILNNLRNLYDTLNHVTDSSPTTSPAATANFDDRHPVSAPPICEAVDETAPTPTTTCPPVSHEASLTTAIPLSALTTPDPADELSLGDAGGEPPVIIPVTASTCPTPLESNSPHTDSQDIATGATQEVTDTSSTV